MLKSSYDAIVVGAGPNGLAAAITLRRAGLSVLLLEGADTPGGGVRSKELTLPGYVHDVCSSVYPLVRLSPFFADIPLHLYGLEFVDPVFAAAHPFLDGGSAVLSKSFVETCERLGSDKNAYQWLMEDWVQDMPQLIPDVLGSFPGFGKPVSLAKFGLRALMSAEKTARKFKTKAGKGLIAGMAAHSMLPFDKTLTTGIAMMLMGAAHHANWPIVKGGAQNLTNALVVYFKSIGGELHTGRYVGKIAELPDARAVLLDVTPNQLISIAADQLSDNYISRLLKFRYGVGVFKIDWALKEPIPFINKECCQAGTVHIGNTFEEIAQAEKDCFNGIASQKPFVLLTQPTVFDPGRAPANQHVAWAYCHVPGGSSTDHTAVIESQIERFAPGFRETIIARHTMNTVEMQQYNPNYVGGDINGGVQDIWQHFSRPVLSISPYRTSAQGIYICSSSTPPGGGVHGMCGLSAAQRALKDRF